MSEKKNSENSFDLGIDFSNSKALQVSCQKRPFEKKSVQWAKIVKEFENQSDKLRIRPLDKKDIPQVAKLFRSDYPLLYRTTRHDFFDENFFLNEAAQLSQWETDSENKKYFFAIVEHIQRSEIIFAMGVLRDSYDRSAQILAGVLKKTYRDRKLAPHFSCYLDDVMKNSGIDYAWGTFDAKTIKAQRVGLSIGMKTGGFMPGMYRWSFDGKNYYRDMLVMMYKFYNNAEEYSTSPEDWQIDSQVVESFQKLCQEIKKKSTD